MEVSHEVKDPSAKGSIEHTYSDGTKVFYKKDGVDYVAPFSKVKEEQYKASQRFNPTTTFLLEIFA